MDRLHALPIIMLGAVGIFIGWVRRKRFLQTYDVNASERYETIEFENARQVPYLYMVTGTLLTVIGIWRAIAGW